MKIFKKIVLAFSVLLALGAFTIAGGLFSYTQKKCDEIAIKMAEQIAWQVIEKPNAPIYLQDLLYQHAHSVIDTMEDGGSMAGVYTPPAYKSGWVKVLAENPQFIHLGIKMFGQSSLETFNTMLVEKIAKRENNYVPDERVEILNRWTIDTFWSDEKRIIADYKYLVAKLLELPNTELSVIMKEVLWEQEYCDCSTDRLATKTHQKLLLWGVIQELPEHNHNYGLYPDEQRWYLGEYPLDLLLAVARWSKDYPDWKPKKILKEAQTMIQELEAILPK